MKKLFIVIFLLASLISQATTYYVATAAGGGSDSNNGLSTGAPFLTIQYGVDHLTSAGDILYIRGGIYAPVADSRLVDIVAANGSGAAGNTKKVYNYPGENVYLSGANFTGTSSRYNMYISGVSYWDIKGINFVNNPGDDNGHNYGVGLQMSAVQYILIEQCNLYECGGGFWVEDKTGVSDYITFLNCDSHDNADNLQAPETPGDYCNGFGAHTDGQTHILFEGCRSWYNSDDGFDVYGSSGYITYSNCWAFDNGYGDGGNGAGFKSGANDTYLESGVQRLIVNCLSFNNLSFGYDKSQDSGPAMVSYLFNNLACGNGQVGFNFQSPGAADIYRNNLSYNNSSGFWPLNPNATIDHNNFNRTSETANFTVTNADFLSVDTTGITGARGIDGSLPQLSLFHPSNTSHANSYIVGEGVYLGGDYGMSNSPDIGVDWAYLAVTPPDVIYVTDVTVTGTGGATTITTDNGTLQMLAAILPVDATYQTVTWSVAEGSGDASISAGGLLTAISDGTVTVTATATDGTAEYGTLVVTLSNQTATSNVFYVKNSGSDSNTGLSDGQAWATIAKVNATTLIAGSTVYFNRGDEWREMLTVGQTGTVDNYITYSAYGTGDDPIINGADVLTSWTSEGSSVWSNDCPALNDYSLFLHDVHYVCVVNGVLFTPVDALVDVNSAGEYFIDDGTSPSTIYIYSITDPGSTVEVSGRMFGALLIDKAYISFESIDFRNCAHTGLFLYSATGTGFAGHSTVSYCNFYRNRESGVYISGGYSDNTVSYCTASYNGNGYYIWSDDEVGANSTGNLYSHNLSEHNIRYTITGALTDGHGYGIYNSTDNIIANNESSGDMYGINLDPADHANDILIEYNYVHDTQASSPGINVGGNVPSGTLHQVYYNLVVNTGGGADGYGIWVAGATRAGTVHLYNNTIYQVGTGSKYGIFCSVSTNLLIRNNIVRIDAASGSLGLILYGASMTGSTISNNLYYTPNDAGAIFYLAGTTYTTIAQWQTATGREAGSLKVNPLFTTAGSNFNLQLGSPAINTGVDVTLTSDITGSAITGLPDMGAYEYQSVSSGVVSGVVHSAGKIVRSGGNVVVVR